MRWTAKGVWVRLFEALAQAETPRAEVLIDSSAVKAHRSAAGGKKGGGAKSGGQTLTPNEILTDLEKENDREQVRRNLAQIADALIASGDS